MGVCYIVFSQKLNRFYIGVTQDDLSNRISKHNNKDYGTNRFTAKADDWTLYLKVDCLDYAQAVRVERYIKKQKSATWIRGLTDQKLEWVKTQVG